MSSTRPADRTTPPSAPYRQLLAEFSALAAAEGLDVQTARPGRLYFDDLPRDQQVRVLARFRSYVEVCREVRAAGHALVDDRQLFWRMLLRRQLRPPSDLLQHMTEGDVLEIYDVDGFVQIFRNLSFFKLCSYSLDELLSRPWYELYRRADDVMAKIHGAVSALLSRDGPDVLLGATGPHDLAEIDSFRRFTYVVEHRALARLYDDQSRIAAIVSVIRVVTSSQDVP